ncbi:MAG: HDIG domain-containing protein [Candidatus Methanomethylophilus sp.]|nr:HDIG domain-containing protein [Methanomethylophilus sp.]MDD4668246.1 HDIG domain-containing protein [Methanomethylophilus sp.]
MSATTDIPSDRQCIDLLWEVGCKKRVVIHCATVRAVAEEIAKGIPIANMKLVIAGALLHDIGRSQIHSIMHAYVGAQIAAEHGLSQEIVDIIRKHTGAGLDQEDVRELGLPPGDYMPRTLEEKIVAHADNMVSDNRVVVHQFSVDKLRAKGADRGAVRIEMLHQELSLLYGRDLDTILDLIGEYPKLKGVRV